MEAILFMQVSKFRIFIIKTSFFCFVFFLIQHVLGMTLDRLNGLTHYNDDGRNRYIRDSVNTEIVLLGSSRCYHHFNPQVFEDSLNLSCYNCGERRMGILYMYDRFQTILQRYTPKVIVYEITPDYDLFYEKDKSVYIKDLRPYYWSDNYAREIVDSISPSEKYKLLSRLYSYNGKVVDVIGALFSRQANYNKGQKPKIGNVNSVIMPHGNKNENDYDSLKLYYIRKLIDECKKRNITLVFSSSPILGEWQGNVFDKFTEWCVNYNVAFLNHYFDVSISLKPALYSDAVHLNGAGSDRYSAIIASELKNIIEDEYKNSICGNQ